jgi:chromate transport protein ChrA
MKALQGALAGVVLAAVTWAVLARVPGRRGVEFLVALLAAAAAVYLGAALRDGREKLIALETAAFAVVFALAMAGLWVTPKLLALGYFVHGAWDFLHHSAGRGADVGTTFPPLCLTYDWIVAVFILRVYY